MQKSGQSGKRIISVIGPPGSGKGTQCEILAKKAGLTHLSVGDMVREAIVNQTELGKLAEPFAKENKLIPDVIINDVLFERLSRNSNEGILLDGFPRTPSQAKALQSRSDIKIERMLLIEVPDDVCMERLLNRNVPGRNDKDEKKNATRLKFYRDNLKGIFDVFRGKIQLVNGNQLKYQVTSNIDDLMAQDPSKGSLDLDISEPIVIKKDAPKELCIICMNNTADHILVPCGHQCGCEGCLTTLKSQNMQCPICKTTFRDFIKVFRTGIADQVEEETKVNRIEKPVPLKKTNSAFNEVNEFEIKTGFDEEEFTNKITIAVAPCDEIKEGSKDPVNVAISINIPDNDCRIPIDVCCVIDISGSMGEDAKFQDPEDETKTITDGLTQLDLVKHAVKTVIGTMTDKDRLSLVAFDTQATLEYPTEFMTEDNKREVVKILEALRPEDSTNIWGGLEVGLDSLRFAEDKDHTRRKFIFLLTDGQPNIKPEGGEITCLENYLSQYPNTAFQINTFGFGYNLDSDLLRGLSASGGGIFGFIPDAKILGTNFVNSIANAATTLCLKAKLHLIPLGGSALAEDLGTDLSVSKQENHIVIELGNLQLGQTRDIVVPMHLTKEENYLAVILEYESQVEGQARKINYVAKSRVPTPDAAAALGRSRVVSQTYQVIKEMAAGKVPEATKMMQELSKFVSDYDNKYENDDPRLNGLVSDLIGFGGTGGRMTKAISTAERFKRWGAHYLRSITRSHQLQLRTNFMDVGLQVYGGKTFAALQNIGGKIFLELPMVRSKPQIQEVHQAQQQQVVVDNSDYYSGGGGGCFDGSCVVDVLHENGKILKTQIKNLKKGDLVCVQENQTVMFAKILAVVRIQLDEKESLVEFNSSKLRLTQKHPVFYENKWQYPIDIVNQNKNIARISPATPNAPNYVYNLVLEHTHVLKVNDAFCVTLGHGIQEAYHPFYGTNAVVDLLKTSKDFEKGFITVKGNIRNLASKMIETQIPTFETRNFQAIHI